jgi:hypothetical protein
MSMSMHFEINVIDKAGMTLVHQAIRAGMAASPATH